MGKDMKRRFVVSLDISTKDAEKQIKSTVGNLKTILADMGKASNKMGYFTELADYLAQVDAEIDRFKQKHGEDLFNKIFGGLDSSLRAEMEKTFGTAKSQLDQLEQIRVRMSNIRTMGDTEEARAEMRALEQDARNLFAALGKSDEIKLSGRGKIETRLESMEHALNSFAIVWDGVNNKIKEGFTFGGTGTGSGGGGGTIESEMERIIAAIEKKNNELIAAKTRLDQTLQEFNNVETDGVLDKYKIDITQESVMNLVAEFDTLQAQLDGADAASADFYDTLEKLLVVSMKLKGAMRDVGNDESLNDMFANAIVSSASGNDTLRGMLSRYAHIKNPLDQNVSGILGRGVADAEIQNNKDIIDALKAGEDVNSIIQQRIDLYDNLKSKLREYNEELQKEFETDEEEDESFKKQEKIEAAIAKMLGVTKKNLPELQYIISSLSDEGASLDGVLQKLYSTFNIEMPDAFKARIESFIGDVGVGAGVDPTDHEGEISAYDTLKKKVKEYYDVLHQRDRHPVDSDEYVALNEQLDEIVIAVEKIKSLDKDALGDLRDVFGDIEYGEIRHTEDALARICDILQIDIPSAVNRAREGLGGMTGGAGDGTGSGTADDMSKKIEEAKVKVQEFNAVIDEINNKSFDWSAEDNVEIGKYLEKLESAKRELDELGEQGLITASELEAINSSFSAMKESLSNRVVHYTGYGSGGGYSYSYYDEYQTEHDRANELQEENERLKEEIRTKSNNSTGDGTDGTGSGSGANGDVITSGLTSLENTVRAESDNINNTIKSESASLASAIKDAGVESISSRLDDVFKVEVSKDETKNYMQSALEGIKQSVDKIVADIDQSNVKDASGAKQTEIDNIKKNLLQMFGIVNEHNIGRDAHGNRNGQELGMTMLSDGSISVNYGEKGTVPWSRGLESLLSNLDKSQILDLHSHPLHTLFDPYIDDAVTYVSDMFSGSKGDLSAMQTSKALGAQLFGMITGNVLRTIDLSKLDSTVLADFSAMLSRVEKEYHDSGQYSHLFEVQSDGTRAYRKQDSLEAQHEVTVLFEQMMYDAFARIGISTQRVNDEIFHKYDMTDDSSVNALAMRIYELMSNTSDALDSVQRLSNIIREFGGTVNTTKAQSLFDAYKKGELSAAEVFNNLANNEYAVSEDRMKALLHIDSANQLSPLEAEVSNIASILSTISSSVDNIELNTNKNASEQIGATIEALTTLASSNGAVVGGPLSGVQSIYDPNNITTYKYQDVAHRANMASETFKQALDMKQGGVSLTGSEVGDALALIESFKTAMQYLQDLEKQGEALGYLLNQRTGDLINFETGESLDDYAYIRSELLNAGDVIEPFTLMLKSVVSDLDMSYATARGNTGGDKQFAGAFKLDVGGDASLIGAEVGQLERLQLILSNIIDLVNQKNQGFRDEAHEVNAAVVSELVDLDILYDRLNNILNMLDAINSAFSVAGQNVDMMSQSFGGVHDGEQTAIQDANSDDIERIQVIVGQLVESLTDVINNVLNNRDAVDSQDGSTTDGHAQEDGYALDKTLQHTNDILGQILGKIGDGSVLADLVAPLNGAVEELKNVAAGIVEHQKAQQTDRGSAGSRIVNNYAELSSLTSNALSGMGDNVKIDNMKALADNVVRVKGAIQDSDGVWKGFVVDINESNNAVVQAIDVQSEFAKSLNESADAAKKTSNQQSSFAKQENDKLKSIRGQLNAEFKNLDFSATTSDPTDDQKELLNLRAQLIEQIEQYSVDVSNGKEVEIDALNTTMSAIRAKIQLYREAHGLESGSKQKFGATATLNATAKYKALKQAATSGEFANSSIVQSMFAQYEASYNKLIAKRRELAQVDGALTDDQKSDFKALQTECDNYAKALNKIITDSQKLDASKANESAYFIGSDFEDTRDGRKAALESFVQQLYGANVAIEKFDDGCRECFFTIQNGDGTLTKMSATFNAAKTQIVALAGETKKATSFIGSLLEEMKGKFRTIFTYLIASFGWQEVFQHLRKGFEYVKEIDSALTELKKVTDETDAAYSHFLQTASKTASVIGSNVADFTNATADFARLGYDLSQASKLAEAASVYKNVGDGINDIATASESIISTMKAYGIEAENAMGIVDRFNEIGNNFAISSTGIGEAMQRSASALYEAGNTIDESIGLITAANSVIQNPEQVGTALKTLALRLRGAKVELEEAGEDVDGMAESTSQLQAKLLALTHGKVDIMLDANTFKNTTQILREMSAAWEDMTDIERASALELMGGKRQANILSSVIKNFDTVESVISKSMNADGSALKENETYLDSIQGKIEKLKNATQTLWMNTLDSEQVKGLVGLVTTLIELVDKIGLVRIALTGLFTYLSISSKSKFDPASMLGIHDINEGWFHKLRSQAEAGAEASSSLLSVLTEIKKTPLQMGSDIEMAGQIDILNAKWGEGQEAFAQYVSGLGDADVAIKAYAMSVQDGNYSLAGFQQFITQHNASVKASGIAAKAAAVGHQLLNAAISMGISFLISTAITAIDKWIHKEEEAAEAAQEAISKANEIKSEFGSTTKTITQNISTIKGLESEFTRLSACVDENGKNISLSTQDYERYKEIVQSIADMSPDVVQGYDAEGNAIINKNNLIKESIKLLQKEQQIEAKRATYQSNWNALLEGIKADITNIPSKENVQKDFNDAITNAIKTGNKDFWDWIYDGDGEYKNTPGLINLAADLGFIDLSDVESGALDGLSSSILFGTASTELADLFTGFTLFDYLPGGTTVADVVKAMREHEDELIGTYFKDREQYNSIIGYYEDYVASDNMDDAIQAYQSEYTDLLLMWAQRSDAWYDLDAQQQNMVEKMADVMFPVPTAEDAASKAAEARSAVTAFVEQLASNDASSDLIDKGYFLAKGLGMDGDKISYEQYLDEIYAFGEKLKSMGFDDATNSAFAAAMGLSYENGVMSLGDSWWDAIDHFQTILGNNYTSNDMFKSLGMDDLLWIRSNISAEPGSMTLQELIQAMRDLKKEKGIGITPIKTFSAYTEDIENFNEAISQTAEIVANNTVVTEEYKQSLLDLGVSQEDLDECFYENNNLLVKNASKLNNLVKEAKNSAAQNVKLARSQARLQYYELYKEINKLTDGLEVTDAATLDYIDSLYDQMNVLEKTIAQYSLLEARLLGTSNAYDKLADAQAADEAADYGSKAEELVNVLGDAINSRELGTEAAKVAIEGLIPASELENLETAEEKMNAIYKYFTTGTISQLFTIEFDDEGAISSVEMTEDNLKHYINSSDVFSGTWDNFTLNPAIQSMKDFMKATNMTKEMAFAFFTELEKYDISWLAGNYDTIMDQLMSGDLEYQLYKNTSELADIEVKIAHGDVTPEDLSKYSQLQQEQILLSQQAADKATAWLYTSDALKESQNRMIELNQELDEANQAGTDYTGRSISAIESDIQAAQTECNELYALMEVLGEAPTEATLQPALDKVKNDIQKFKDDLKSKQAMDVITYDNGVQVFTPKDPAALYIEGVIEKIDTVGFEALGLERDVNGDWVGLAEIEGFSDLDEDSKKEVIKYIDMLEDEHSLNILMGEGVTTIETHLENIVKILQDTYQIMVGTKVDEEPVNSFVDWLNKTPFSKVVTFGAKVTNGFNSILGRFLGNDDNPAGVNGTANANGTAYKSGSWGAPKTETALTGELGPEMLVRGNQWHLVGENGAEFTQVKRGDIIFNHKQTEELLKNGHVSGRGKAYAHGTVKTSGAAYAYAIGTTADEDDKIKKDLRSTITDVVSGSATAAANLAQKIIGGVQPVANAIITAAATVVDTWGNNSADLSSDYSGEKTGGGSGDSGKDFDEKFDWIDIKLEEVNEDLDLFAAELDNCATYTDKNAKIQQMMAKNIEKQDWLKKGIARYEEEANKYLSEIDSQYHDMVKDGAIAIEQFAGEADEATLEAIKSYRDYIQKAADLTQQLEEVESDLRQLAIDKIHNAEHTGSVKDAVEDAQTEKLQNAVDYDEARGLITDPSYYAAMMENSKVSIGYLTTARNKMQKAFDEAVENGQLEVGSDLWYEELASLYEMDAQIDEAVSELEEFQNAINDIYWDSFDQLISEFDYISEDAQGLIDLMSSADMTIKPTDQNGWSAEDVQWTDEGLATIGLHAQEMERADAKAKAYATAIDDLTADYEAGHYSEAEYKEKLNELTQGQYDAIQAAQDSKDAIIDLQKARVEEIKKGIEKQIKAYKELIEKRKEELASEKDLRDFQRSTMEQQKNIATIERQLAALANDNSMAAIAKRKKLEAELAEAQYELENTYYDRSVEDKQNALDQEQEDFTAEKEAEMEQLDLWLEDVEAVIAESLGIVQENAAAIGQTLTDQASEYNLTVSDAVLKPWEDGASAISSYTSVFGDAASSTTAQLEPMRAKWQAIKEELAAANAEADKYYSKTDATADGPSVAAINSENAGYVQAKKKADPAPAPSGNSNSGNSNHSNQPKAAPSVGSTVTVQKTATNFGSKSGNARMASFVPGGSYTVYQVSGSQILIGRNGVYTGWVNQSDLQEYAKGTLGVKQDQLAWIDELGEELQLVPGQNGRLEYIKKGTGVVPADLTERIMDLAMNPQEVLDRSRPAIGAPHITNNEISINMNIAEVVHIDEVTNDTLPNLTKAVEKQIDSYMVKLNNSLKRFTR